ncbi:MAG: GAF domain-containing protein [Deltaproteobacteria bacterium]|nr:GAF domain-containing protein [Deltaproteobacteria bacterium]
MSRRRRVNDAGGPNLPLQDVAWLAEVASRIGSAGSSGAIGEACAAVQPRFIDIEPAQLCLTDLDDGALRLVHAPGLSEAQRQREEAQAATRPPGTVLRTAQPMVVRDAFFAVDHASPGVLRRAAIRTRLTLPIQHDGEVLGALTLT